MSDETSSGDNTSHPLFLKLEAHGALPNADRNLLRHMFQEVRTFTRRRDIISEGENPEYVHLMLEGWACRYAVLRNGGRQITALLLPGDFCDAHVQMLGHMDHSIGSLGPTRVAFVSRDLMDEVSRRPALTRALWWSGLVDEAVLRAWIVNLGRRSAIERVAHFMCELHTRLANVGLLDGPCRFRLPMSQEDLADATGQTPVNVNRVLRTLRLDGIMSFARGHVVVKDIAMLRDVANFDAGYLHMNTSAAVSGR